MNGGEVIPYTNVFLQSQDQNGNEDGQKERFMVLHAQVTALRAHSVTYRSLSSSANHESGKEETLAFDYAIYALGAHMPPPLDLWGGASSAPGSSDPYTGLKAQGRAFFVDKQAEISRVAGKGENGGEAGSVLVVGGGALGIRALSFSLCGDFVPRRTCDEDKQGYSMR